MFKLRQNKTLFNKNKKTKNALFVISLCHMSMKMEIRLPPPPLLRTTTTILSVWCGVRCCLKKKLSCVDVKA